MLSAWGVEIGEGGGVCFFSALDMPEYRHRFGFRYSVVKKVERSKKDKTDITCEESSMSDQGSVHSYRPEGIQCPKEMAQRRIQ
jgi:hypothetical protein